MNALVVERVRLAAVVKTKKHRRQVAMLRRFSSSTVNLLGD